MKLFLLILLFLSPQLWAVQDAVVSAEDAIVYADQKMTSPVGYIKKGKRIKIGDIPRNRRQVYPVVVSGKVAYIRVIDVNTERETVDPNAQMAERFRKGTTDIKKTNFSLLYLNYASQVTLDHENDKLKDKDAVNWTGLGLRSGIAVNPDWDVDVLLNYLSAREEDEIFTAVEMGVGGARRLVETRRFLLKLNLQFLLIPYSTYKVVGGFDSRGYGFSTGTALNATYRIGKNWGIDGYGGFYYSKLMGFRPDEPYQAVSPSFMGSRFGVGVNYAF